MRWVTHAAHMQQIKINTNLVRKSEGRPMHRQDDTIQMYVMETGCQWGLYQSHNSPATGTLNMTTNIQVL
jgi:hypothetical protein